MSWFPVSSSFFGRFFSLWYVLLVSLWCFFPFFISSFSIPPSSSSFCFPSFHPPFLPLVLSLCSLPPDVDSVECGVQRTGPSFLTAPDYISTCSHALFCNNNSWYHQQLPGCMKECTLSAVVWEIVFWGAFLPFDAEFGCNQKKYTSPVFFSNVYLLFSIFFLPPVCLYCTFSWLRPVAAAGRAH